MVFRFFTILLLLLISVPSPAWADTVILRTGRRIHGKIITQNRRVVRIRTGGRTQIISKIRIRKIRYGAVNKAEIARAERARRYAAWVARRRRARERDRDRVRKRDRVRERARKNVARAKQARKKTPPAKRSVPSRESDSFQSLWQSALVPGLGRYRQGRRVLGGLWFSGFVMAAGFLASEGGGFTSARNEAQTNNDLWNVLSLGGDTNIILLNLSQRRSNFAAVQSAGNTYRGAGALLAVVYLANLIDAFFFSGDTNEPRRLTDSVPGAVRIRFVHQIDGPKSEPGSGALRISFHARF